MKNGADRRMTLAFVPHVHAALGADIVSANAALDRLLAADAEGCDEWEAPAAGDRHVLHVDGDPVAMAALLATLA